MTSEFKITHKDDPDGLISMALLARATASVVDQYDHWLISYDGDETALRTALDLVDKKGTVYVADINFSDRLANAGGSGWALMWQLAAKSSVKWLDHHDGTKQHQTALEDLGIEVSHPGKKQVCAAVLVAKAMSCNSRYERTLAGIAQVHDYQNDVPVKESLGNLRLGLELQKVISWANSRSDLGMLLELVADLKSEIALSSNQLADKWRGLAKESDQQAQLAYSQLEQSVKIAEIAGYRVAFAYCPAILSQKPGFIHLRETVGDRADLYVCLYAPPVRNHIILQRTGSSFPLEKLLKELGGGGRNGGGGYSVNYDLDAERVLLEKERLSGMIEAKSLQKNL